MMPPGSRVPLFVDLSRCGGGKERLVRRLFHLAGVDRDVASIGKRQQQIEHTGVERAG
jgi:hypothetical protein